MSYYGYQGIHSSHPTFRHRDGSISEIRPSDGIIAYHDHCAHEAFEVDTTKKGHGGWHHDKGMSWSPGNYSLDNHPCELCGDSC